MGLIESNDLNGCDLYIINTCAVTAESSRKSRQMIRRASSAASAPVVIAMGCWTQIEPEKAEQLGCVDLIIGTSDKQSVCEKALELLKKKKDERKPEITIGPINKYDRYSRSFPESVREYLKIEDGCNGKCAYCVIPKARGGVRSRDPREAMAEARRLCENGVKELIVTGIELSGYQYGLTDLLSEISKIDGLKRIRLGSLDPAMINDKLIAGIINNKKVMPHFHLSIQSGCSRTLAAMRRKYNADAAMRSIELLRSAFPDVMLTCDLIVGFPGETDEDFSETVSFMKQAGFLHAHVFPFSPRPGTEAAGMAKQIDKPIKETRLHIIESLQNKTASDLINGIINKGYSLRVLVEKNDNGVIYGHSENFIPVTAGSPSTPGEIIEVIPFKYDGEVLNCK